jgi:hypothetical protein
MRDFNPNGEIVGRPTQAVNEESLTQKYPIGTKYESWGKIWRYCQAAATITLGKRGCPNLADAPWTGSNATYGLGSDDTTITGTQGSYFVDVTQGHAHLHTLDEFQGGMLTLYPAAGIAIHQYRIIGNDAGSTTSLFRLYIDPPLLVDETTTPCDISPSPYKNVGNSPSVGVNLSVVCVPEILVTTAYYFWGQTHGPCYVPAATGDWTTGASRNVVWHTNGCVKIDAADALQNAGYLLQGTGTNGDTHIMLLLE